MDLITTAYGWEFLLRYMHFLAGITWIGVLYYFNFIQTPFFGTELGGQAKSAMTRGLVPNALWWFRWGAMFTFLTGWTIVLMKLGHGMDISSGYMQRIITGGIMCRNKKDVEPKERPLYAEAVPKVGEVEDTGRACEPPLLSVAL